MEQRIWIYTLSKELSKEELSQLLSNCNRFVNIWTAHDNKLTADCEIVKQRLLIMKVDESDYRASGCSMDKLNRFILEQEASFSIQLLNRLLVAIDKNNEVEVIHSSKISDLLKSGEMNENTLVYDNTITSTSQMPVWKKPLKETWLSKFLNSTVI